MPEWILESRLVNHLLIVFIYTYIRLLFKNIFSNIMTTRVASARVDSETSIGKPLTYIYLYLYPFNFPQYLFQCYDFSICKIFLL